MSSGIAQTTGSVPVLFALFVLATLDQTDTRDDHQHVNQHVPRDKRHNVRLS